MIYPYLVFFVRSINFHLFDVSEKKARRVGAPLIATAPVIATYLYIYSQLSYIEPYSAILISNISATRVGNIILTAHACFVHTNKDRHFNFSGCHQTLVSLQLSLRNPW
jgi:hypothetical protein